MVVLLTTASLEGQHLAKSFFNTGLLGAAGTPTGSSDDQFNRVSFLSHFEGSNNGVNNAFDDGSASNHTITANGNVTQGSFGPFARPDGEWGVSLNTNTSVNETGYLRAPSSGNFGTGNFTYEAWVYFVEGGGSPVLLENSGGAVAVFRFGNTTSYLFGNNSATGQTSVTFSDLSAATFQWHHIALVRSSGVIKCYLNGTASSTTLSSSQTTGAAEYIGTARNYTSGSRLFDGYISNVRFSDIARYTSNFTPSTAPFVSDSNTDLLTCQSNRFVDNSSNGRTVTPYGSAAVTAFGPFLTSSVYDPAVNGASVYIAAGDSDYLSMPAQTIPTGNFTVEGWYYLDGTQSNSTIIAQGSSGNAARTFVGIEAVGGVQSLRFQMGSSLVTPNFAAIPNQWTHFCATYNGSAMELFQNGVSGGTTSRSGDAENVAMVIGRLNTNWANSYGVKGYISNIRVSSVVRQSSNFTPPTAPLTNVDSNVKFLANMADGQAIDSAAQNNLTLYGNAKISTGQAKFGNTSLYLDGSDDYLVVNNHKAYGTGPFTIEMFFRLDSVSGSRCLYDDRPDGASGDYISLIIASGAVNFYVGTTLKVDAGSISANTFYHIALCRSGTDTKLFLDGTQIGSTFSSDTTNYLNTGILRVGTNRGYNNDLAGYIDEFRISHMARYTSNFTAPTKAFTDKGQQT